MGIYVVSKRIALSFSRDVLLCHLYVENNLESAENIKTYFCCGK